MLKKYAMATDNTTNNRLLISDICSKAQRYLTTIQVKKIYAAYLLAAKAHDGQYRKSGEAYVFHPLAVAMILIELKVDCESIVAAILHDCIEDTCVTKSEIADEFGDKVAHIVDGVSKLDGLENKTNIEKQATNFRKLLLAASKDIRVILIKLADRLHNMRTISSMSRESQIRIAKETIDVYIPISRRIGIGKITKELKDLSFRTQNPMRYKTLALKLNSKYVKNSHLLRDAIKLFETKMQDAGINAEILGRKKDLVSIYHKMRDKKIKFNEVLDLYGLRVVVESVSECYQALGVIHNSCKPIPGSFKDYIALPKNNGYQSLHTVIFGRNKQTIEVQIRTSEMDSLASYGIASHWYYKNSKNDNPLQNLSPNWINSLINGDENDEIFLDKAKAEMSKEDIFVFTPNGEIIKLPYGSVALDFAYFLHTDIGNKALRAKIDNINTAITTKIKSGQTIEIITSKNLEVSIDWLDFSATLRAKNAIKNTLKSNNKESLVSYGKTLLTDVLYYNGVDIAKINNWDLCLKELSIENKYILFIKIALKEILLSRIIRALLKDDDIVEIVDGVLEKTQGIESNCAKCCYPLPGDKVVGILGTSKGLIIHRENCANAKHADSVIVDWRAYKFDKFQTRITCYINGGRGELANIINFITDMNINIINIEIKEKFSSTVIEFILEIKNLNSLNKLIKNITLENFIKTALRC